MALGLCNELSARENAVFGRAGAFLNVACKTMPLAVSARFTLLMYGRATQMVVFLVARILLHPI